jgi:immune inhibitor A
VLYNNKLLGGVIAAALLSSSAFASTEANKQNTHSFVHKHKHDTHDLRHPLGDKQRAMRKKALEHKIKHKLKNKKVHRLGKRQYVELERESEDLIWTVLASFSDTLSPDYGGLPGPQYNKMPEPDRSVNNTTIWRSDFSRDHYLSLLFDDTPGANSMRNFYIEQSSGRYAVDGDVTDWVQVPYNTAHYGYNFCGGNVCSNVWFLVEDAVDGWYESQIAEGKTPEEINAYLAQFDVWDRYDHDSDGNFDEPDGYIDHFQTVHAGAGTEAGGGAYGDDAIWSHRWYVQLTPLGQGGPVLEDGTHVLNGGTQVGESRYWIGDYTVEPENGGVGVFAHEFAHDLDLPDLYDTGDGENSTGFWTLMSSGSWTSDGKEDIGSKPIHMGAWEKLQLGWLNYDEATAATRSKHVLGPAEFNTKHAQALIVTLPDLVVETNLGQPYAGSYFYYSGAGDNLNHQIFRNFTLPAAATVTAQVRFDIEPDWDYAYVIISDDGGNTWSAVDTSLSSDSNPNGNNFGGGITGSTDGNWVELSADLSAYVGDVLLGFRYWTDGAATHPGFMVDEIAVQGSAVDGAETDTGWTYSPATGFTITTGLSTDSYFNAYIAEYRQYLKYDRGLKTGPYNFGFTDTNEDWVEHFPYQKGLLISYWNSAQTDNNTSAHPGEGLILPIDAHPEPLYDAFGNIWRNRIQSYDSTFSLKRTKPLKLHVQSEPSSHPSLPAQSVFSDSMEYWSSANPGASVKTPDTDTSIRIKRAKGGVMKVVVDTAQ